MVTHSYFRLTWVIGQAGLWQVNTLAITIPLLADNRNNNNNYEGTAGYHFMWKYQKNNNNNSANSDNSNNNNNCEGTAGYHLMQHRDLSQCPLNVCHI